MLRIIATVAALALAHPVLAADAEANKKAVVAF